MFEPFAGTVLGNPVLAGLAAFAVTSTALAAVGWFARSAFGSAKTGRQSAIGTVHRLCGAFLSRSAGMWRRARSGKPNGDVCQPRSKAPEGEGSSAHIDFKALQRELDEAFAPVWQGARDPDEQRIAASTRLASSRLPTGRGGAARLLDPPAGEGLARVNAGGLRRRNRRFRT